MKLDNKSADILLQIAREAIDACLGKTTPPNKTREEEILNQSCGCFVTITTKGTLRGCIGQFVSDQPLYLEVAHLAVAAATADPRFYPMSAKDIGQYELEISVLSPLTKITDPKLIEVGVHGIYLTNGYSRGVLLPQVAVEHGWNRLTFLKQTCIKAGLPTDAWQSAQTEIAVFSAQIISEPQQPGKHA